jgi:prepilin-type N-terminal cleavage/methylation domain-containing protein
VIRRAFTLAELLCVIAILAVLAGLVFMAASGVLRFAKRTACTANLRQVGMAALAYAADHRDRLPAEQNYGIDDPKRSPAWFFRLPPYTEQTKVSGRSIFQCPGHRGEAPQVFTNATPKSYKFNSYLDNRGRHRHYRLGSARGESRIVMFTDAVAGETGMGQWGQCFASAVDDSRHAGAVCVLCLDGSTLERVSTPADGDWMKALRWLPEGWKP